MLHCMGNRQDATPYVHPLQITPEGFPVDLLVQAHQRVAHFRELGNPFGHRVNLFSRQVFDFIDSQVIDDKRLSLGSWGEQIYRDARRGGIRSARWVLLPYLRRGQPNA